MVNLAAQAKRKQKLLQRSKFSKNLNKKMTGIAGHFCFMESIFSLLRQASLLQFVFVVYPMRLFSDRKISGNQRVN